MRRVVAVSNGKGGVGKTSLTSGLAGLVAASGYKVLTIDADPQGNLRRDLGYDKADDGRGLAQAIRDGGALEPLRDVRPGLDCVVGGSELWDLPAAFVSRTSRGVELSGLSGVLRSLRPSGEPHADYDLVLVDTPPGEPILQDLVLAAADYLVVPTRSDDASIDGLVSVAERFVRARQHNPDLTLLGVVLFGVGARSTRLRQTVRAVLDDILEGAAPVFEASIRYLESASIDIRRHGMLPHELEATQASAQSERLARLRSKEGGGEGERLLSRNVSGLAGDYNDLARELLQTIADHESQRLATGTATTAGA